MYRDDEEALLARVEALQAEADELRGRVGVLERANAELETECARLREHAARAARSALPPERAAPSAMVLRIRERDDTREERFEIGVITIGREEADIVLRDHAVDRLHAVIQSSSSGVVVADLGSKIGTRVNGEDVKIRTLHLGDTIQIGDASIDVVAGPPA
jgi:hypothetical protein